MHDSLTAMAVGLAAVIDRKIGADPRHGAAGIDHMLAKKVAFFGLDQPFAARLLRDVGGPAAVDDPCTLGPCSGSKRLGDAGRVGMAVFRRVERGLHAFQILERVVAADFLRPDEFDRKAEGAADTNRVAHQSTSSSA